MATPFDIGDGVRILGTFRNLDEALEDPSSVVIKVLDPLGVLTTPEVVRLSVGAYYADVLATVARVWLFRIEGHGAVQAAEEGQFTVRTSNFIG